jgi:hypothetical protein
MMAFESAVKVGAPITLTKIVDSKTGEYLNSEDGVGVPYPKEFDPASIIEINNRFLRLQLNPAHDPFALTTNPSQMVYMPATNMEVNLEKHNEILDLQGSMINMGAKKIHRLFRLNKGKPTAATRKAVRNRAIQSWFDMGGYESL